jgi:hypothetical protein
MTTPTAPATDSTTTLPRSATIARAVSSGFVALAGLLATAAGITAAASLPEVPNATLMVETWRVVGLFTFAALFALLAFRPLLSSALWLIVIASKFVLAASGLAFGHEVSGSLEAAAWDGSLVVLLGAGFLGSCAARRRLAANM